MEIRWRKVKIPTATAMRSLSGCGRLAISGLLVSSLATGANYFYDNAGRLLRVDYGSAGIVSYTYDKAGNLITRQVLAAVGATANAPTITSVTNAEGGSTVIAPNTWVAVFGTNLAPAGDSRAWGAADFLNNALPSQLDNVSVTVNGKSAFVYYISSTQVNILTPPDPMQGSVQVQVTNGSAVSAPFTAQAQPASPSFFLFANNYVCATHVDGSLIGPTTLYPGLSTPAKPGETIIVYGNGFGPVSTPVSSTSLSQAGSLPTLPVIKIGGIAATVQFAGLISPGLYQFNVVVPSTALSVDNAIIGSYNGVTTQTAVLTVAEH